MAGIVDWVGGKFTDCKASVTPYARAALKAADTHQTLIKGGTFFGVAVFFIRAITDPKCERIHAPSAVRSITERRPSPIVPAFADSVRPSAF